jgi:hypothetical protein
MYELFVLCLHLYIGLCVKVQVSKLAICIVPFVFDLLFCATEGIGNCLKNIVAKFRIPLFFTFNTLSIAFSYLID